jgi:hypothetical protein
MITLSKSAKKSLEDYLRQARAYLRGSRSVDANEVEQNIAEHIENELEGAAEPVSCDALDAVLKKLGSPQQWVPEEELSWWRKIILRIRSGSEDWRLAYLSFSLLVVGFLFLPYAPVGIVLILASFLVSRAALSEAVDLNELKAQKWFLYPSLIILYVFVLLALLTWPLGLLIPLADGYERHFSRLQNDLDYWVTAMSVIIAVLGLWWSIMAAVILASRKMVRVLFRPFADVFKPKWVLLFLLIGLGLTILSLGWGILYYRYFI